MPAPESNGEDPDLIDRPRGILNEDDRRFLFGDLDLSDYSDPRQARYQRRYRIRERIKHSIIDYLIIMDTLPDEDINKIFEEITEYAKGVQNEDADSEPPIPSILDAWMAVFAFFAYGAFPTNPYITRIAVEEGLEHGLNERMLQHGEVIARANVKVTWGEAEVVMTLDEAEEKARSGELLEREDSLDILASLVRAGRLDAEEAIEIRREHLDPNNETE